MLLAVKTRLCLVTLASLATAHIWIVLSGCPPSTEHNTGQVCFTPIQWAPLTVIPSWERSVLPPLSSWQMVNVLHLQCLTLTNYGQLVQLSLALPSAVTPEPASNLSPPPQNFDLRTSSQGTMPALCTDFQSGNALCLHMLTNNLYSCCTLSLNFLTDYIKTD